MIKSVVKLWSCDMTFHQDDVRGRVAFDDEQLIELLIDVGRVNAQAGEDGSLQQILQRVAPGRQEHEQGREQSTGAGANSEWICAKTGACTVAMTPTMNSAKATLNSRVWSSPHLARNVGKMLSNVAMMNAG